LDVEQARLQLIRDGKLPVGADELGRSGSSSDQFSGGFDISGNLRLLPKFSERDPDTFFALFERVADMRKWPDSARTLMLQCVLTGKAQEVYSALSAVDSQKYSCVKSAVQKAYELVPEAYRQWFRFWRMGEKQSS